MTIRYTARSGKTYYLHVTASAKGKGKYFFSTKAEGLLAQSLPDEYEVYETVNAQVFLRKKTAQLILDDEIALIRNALKDHAQEWKYKAEIKKNMIVIHEACQEFGFDELVPPWMDKAKLERMKLQMTTYMPIMRFVLEDKKDRIFQAERFCFLGSVDDWIMIGRPGKLPALSKKFIRHLGQESFFELM